MTTRRDVLYSVGIAGATVSLAGCSDQEQATDETSPEETEGQEADDTDEAETEVETVLPDVSLEFVEFRHGFSRGLTVRVNVRYNAEDGSERFYTHVEAYSGDELIGDRSTWETIGAGRTTEIELVIEEVTALEEYGLDDLTEVVVIGQQNESDRIELESFSGETVRERIEG